MPAEVEPTAEVDRGFSSQAELRRIADTYEAKYGTRLTDPVGTWFGLSDAIRSGDTLLYRVAPTVVFGFRKGRESSQTRWTFS